MEIDIDMRPRCRQCGKIPRGKMRNTESLRYKPFCSFHCQETGRMQNALRYVKTLQKPLGNAENA